MALGDYESVAVQATISEGAVPSGDVKSSSEFVGKAVGQLPRVIEIGSDMSQIEAQIGLDDDTEVPTEPKVRISNYYRKETYCGAMDFGDPAAYSRCWSGKTYS